MSEKDDLVVVHHATSPGEAEVVRGVLEDAGIRAMISDVNTPLPGIDLTPFDNETGVAGCEVQVAAKDSDRAREVIRKAREENTLDDTDEP